MGYLYETHLHTAEASACGRTPGREYAAYMKEKGYSGFIVTDHFFSGNSCVPSDLPWRERVDWYCSGYEHAREAAEGMDLSVFFGIEYRFDGDEYLLYGVDRNWLLAHPDLLSYDRRQVYRAVHEGGGIMIQAHPYRERGYLDSIHLMPSVSDGIEIYNSGNEDYMNALAYEYALSLGVPMTAGSDIHFFYDGWMGGMLFEEKLGSVKDYARAVMAGKGKPVAVRADGAVIPVTDLPDQCVVTREPTLPVYRH